MGCMHPQLHLYWCSRPTDFLCIFRTFMFAIAGEIDCQVVNTQKYWIFSFRSFVPETPVKDARSLDSAGGSAARPHHHAPTIYWSASAQTYGIVNRIQQKRSNGHKLNMTNQQHRLTDQTSHNIHSWFSNIASPSAKKVCWWCLCTMWSRLLLNRMQAQYTSCALTS